MMMMMIDVQILAKFLFLNKQKNEGNSLHG